MLSHCSCVTCSRSSGASHPSAWSALAYCSTSCEEMLAACCWMCAAIMDMLRAMVGDLSRGDGRWAPAEPPEPPEEAALCACSGGVRGERTSALELPPPP